MKSIATLLGAALLCGSMAVHAQATGTPAPGAAPPAKEQRPQLTPEQKAKYKADFQAAREACKDSKDRGACMTETFCSKQADKAKCQERAKHHREHHRQHAGMHMDRHQEMAEACTGKRGDALKQCYKEQHDKRRQQNPSADPAPAKK